ncbi:hypothetical protein Lbir_0445 [Legionella birminghamensis]|uniref:Uncharacterized protein n=1 Tax=Legionella birminghamensis TaxID=28083 RepID=A0A378ICW7_9GAMM|nr:hypothetical protein [Legionella birminghamensis]KTC75300.1 hypothetical protein Lbir_0445 [Legionella birminghamensis]STX33067.1 Uncharacterised protein [Legionella birminghamensis]
MSSYVTGFKSVESHWPKGHVWDFDTRHVLSTHAIHHNAPEILLTPGSHHKTGQEINTGKHYRELEKFLLDCYPQAEQVYRWSAQHYQAADAIPLPQKKFIQGKESS